jgi:segregation and condensation protein A
MVAATDTEKQQGQAPLEKLWEDADPPRASGEPALVVDVAGFEGPLDLLLHLARNQKVDLSRISIVALVDQYLRFIEQVRALRLELAADYLVMAAWLAYLKSRLLIPKKADDQGQSGEEMAAVLQFRLKRLEAMRDAAARLVTGSAGTCSRGGCPRRCWWKKRTFTPPLSMTCLLPMRPRGSGARSRMCVLKGVGYGR